MTESRSPVHQAAKGKETLQAGTGWLIYYNKACIQKLMGERERESSRCIIYTIHIVIARPLRTSYLAFLVSSELDMFFYLFIYFYFPCRRRQRSNRSRLCGVVAAIDKRFPCALPSRPFAALRKIKMLSIKMLLRKKPPGRSARVRRCWQLLKHFFLLRRASPFLLGCPLQKVGHLPVKAGC